jgi:catechol 2,3-dioxygenase-like lactoylglutathione lyase family enzyme
MKASIGILETAIYAEDIDQAEAFYRDVFGLEVVTKVPGRLVFLKCGQQMLLVFDPVKSAEADPEIVIPRHGARGPGHFCFRARDAAEVAEWRDHFRKLGIPVEHDHVWKDGARSLYVRDPAGNSVEVGEARMWGIG